MSGFHGPEESEALRKRIETDQEKGISRAPMSAEEQHAVKEKMAALDAFFSKRIDAQYKVELQFGKERSTWKPFPGAMSLYLSGSKLNGGADEKLYLCPRDDCSGVIYPKERLGPSVMCRSCEMMWNESKLIGELLFRLTPQDWATVILRCFMRLENRADIYVKYHPTDIRYQTEMEIAKKRGGEAVNKARSNRALHIYPLANIIKDTSNGADLHKRILAFITA